MTNMEPPEIDPDFEILELDAVCQQCGKDFISWVSPPAPMCLKCAQKEWDGS